MRIFFDSSPIFIPKIANTRSKRAKKAIQRRYRTRNSQKATAAAAATFSEST